MTHPTLRRPARGADVRRLQELLNAKGAELVVDGDFGPATERAVKQAQKKAGQAADGVAGAALWAWLEARGGPTLSRPSDGASYSSGTAFSAMNCLTFGHTVVGGSGTTSQRRSPRR